MRKPKYAMSATKSRTETTARIVLTSMLGIGHLNVLRIPCVARPHQKVERIRVDDERAAQVADVEEVEWARRGPALHDGGVLVVERAVAGAVELVLGRVPRHGAAEVGAPAIDRGDRAGGVEQEELAFREQLRL